MKFKHSSVILFSMVLLFFLSVCISDSSAAPAPKTAPKAAPAAKAANDNPYKLDYKSQQWQKMSDKRLSEAVLIKKYDELSKTKHRGTMDYNKVVEFMGAEPSRYKFNGTNRVFEWQAQGSAPDGFSVKCMFVLFSEKNEKWLNSVCSKRNI